VNELASSSSIYLRSHADDPIDWKEYSETTLEAAREAGRLLLVSIGYSACHWCHVMARETFSRDDVATYLNAHFVCIKIDREERPDLDAYYMDAVVAQQGGGGWPLTIFARADGTPLYGATYLPPRGSRHAPGLLDIAERIVELAHTDRNALEAAARSFKDLFEPSTISPQRADISRLDTVRLVGSALDALSSHMDNDFFGFGRSPKFPQAYLLRSLWEAQSHPNAGHTRDFVINTLRALGHGGIFDHPEGGFFRYSTDRFFMVPHFEKMLIDQVDICEALALVAADSHDTELIYLTEKTVAFTLETFMREDGLMATSIDADFQGVEGGYYLFTPAEIAAVSAELAEFYGVNPGGIYEGQAIFHRPRDMTLIPPEHLGGAISRLISKRHQRGTLPRDDKALCSLNARFGAMLSRAGRFLGHPEWVDAAQTLSDHIKSAFLAPDGFLTHSLSGTTVPHFSDDYVSFAALAIENFSVTGDPEWLTRASDITDVLVSQFLAKNPLGFYISDAQGPRNQDRVDGAHAATLTRAASLLTDLGSLTENQRNLDLAAQLVASALNHEGVTLPAALIAHRLAGGTTELALPGTGPSELRSVALATTLPSLVLAQGKETILTKDRVEGLAYLCRNRVCKVPISDPATLTSELLKIREQMFA